MNVYRKVEFRVPGTRKRIGIIEKELKMVMQHDFTS